MFDVLAFLEHHEIEIDPRRSNSKNVYIHCPWCGDDDESSHMGIRTDGEKFGCWRNEDHRGSDLRELVRELLHCTWDEATEIVRGQRKGASSSWDDLRKRLAGEHTAHVSPDSEPVAFPVGVEPLTRQRAHRAFWRYVQSRGFRRKDVAAVVDRYQLHVGVSGKWRGRLVIPFVEGGILRGWTGRSIGRGLRYLTWPEGGGTKTHVMNHDLALEGGRVLALVEGPLDAVKLDFYGRTFGLCAIPLLGTSMTEVQAEKITDLAEHFDRVVAVLDAAALANAIRMTRRFAVLRPRVRSLPAGVKDPGDMEPLVAMRFARDIVGAP